MSFPRALAILPLLLLVRSDAFATWSILAVEKSTKTVVIASATCVPQVRFANFPAKGLMDIQAIVVPGKGVAAAQATVDQTRAQQKLIFDELEKGTPPADILKLVTSDARAPLRQFAILDVQGAAVAWTGPQNQAFALDRQDTAGEDIVFTILGNSLAHPDVILLAVQAFKETKGTLTDRVMAAMEAADGKGGDRRCTCAALPPFVNGKNPLEGIPCDAKTAHVAYLLKADAADTNGSSYNDGHYAVYLSVTDRDVTKSENANPVKTLRKRYEAWKKAAQKVEGR